MADERRELDTIVDGYGVRMSLRTPGVFEVYDSNGDMVCEASAWPLVHHDDHWRACFCLRAAHRRGVASVKPAYDIQRRMTAILLKAYRRARPDDAPDDPVILAELNRLHAELQLLEDPADGGDKTDG